MRLLFFGAAVAALLTTAVLGQSTGSISGTVTDTQQSAVPGAIVTLTESSRHAVRTVSTDATGHFMAAELAPGSYSVTAAAASLRLPRPQTVALGQGGSVRLTLVLHVTQAGQQVTVTGRAPEIEGQAAPPAVDKDSSVVTNVIAGLTVTYLPNRDRDFTQFGALSAGADTTPQGLNVDGQRADATAVKVNGENFDDPLEGGPRGGADGGFFFPQTVVQEFQVVHAGAGADADDSNGGFVNVSTKEGSDRIHGEQFVILRPGAWTGHDGFNHPLDDSQTEFGGSVGGPIVQRKAYYYVGGEQDFLHSPYWTEFQPQAPGTVVPASLTALQTQTVGRDDPTALSLRLDFNLSAQATLNLEGTYNRVHYDDVSPGSTQVYAAASNGDALSGQSDWLHANLTTTAGAIVNQLMAQWAGDRRDLMPNSTAPEVVINGFGTLGGDALGPHRFVSDQRGLSDDLAWAWHGQLLHFGGSFAYDPGIEMQQPNLNGQYEYTSLAQYLAASPYRFQQSFANSPQSIVFEGAVQQIGVYVSDRIPLGEKLTLTAGVRWDGQRNPQENFSGAQATPATTVIPNDLSQWQPRLGLAWNPRPRTDLRLSAGLFDAPTPAAYFARAITEDGLNTVVADSDYDPGLLAQAAGGQGFTAPPAGLATQYGLLTTVAPGFRNPRSFQSAASVEQQFGKRFDLTTGYDHDETWNLERMLNTNLGAPTTNASGMPVFPATRPLANVGQFLDLQSSAHSNYDGWTNTANVTGPYRLSLSANYTLARTRDDASAQGPFGAITALNPFDLATEAADADQDMRHNFNISATDEFWKGLKINPIFIAHSGLPYTPIVGFDTQNDGNDLNDRASLNGAVAARNSLRQPAACTLDLRFVKDFTLKGQGHHLDLFLDVFNLANFANRDFGPLGVSQYGNAAFPVFAAGLPLFDPASTAFGGARQIQFTARLVGF